MRGGTFGSLPVSRLAAITYARQSRADDCHLFVCSVFDKMGEGWIMSADLRDVMKHLGERLSDIEVDDMLKEADRDNNGRVFYQGECD